MSVRGEGVYTIDDRFSVVALDDDASILRVVQRILTVRGCEVQCFRDYAALFEQPGLLGSCDVLLLDVDMPKCSGIHVLQKVKAIEPHLPVVMLTADSSAETAVAALMAGALNYILKTHLATPDALFAPLARAVAHGRLHRRMSDLQDQVEVGQRFGSLVGNSEPMRKLVQTIDKVAPLDVSVLITGESGTGKELVAKAIHEASRRVNFPLVAMNCGALPETLIDSELFGHTKGAFTGATSDRPGIFERAQGGTVFLDEIGEMPLDLQARLLRVLQEKEVTPVGAGASKKIDVRVIAATHVNLEDAVRRTEFRDDLFYRLNVVRVDVPALRYRRSDIPLLVAHFVNKHASLMKRAVPQITPAFQDALQRCSWPGNVRELENILVGALALCHDELDVHLLPIRFSESSSSTSLENTLYNGPGPITDGAMSDEAWSHGLTFTEAREKAIRLFEERFLRRVLTECQGNISEASRKCGLDRSNFRRVLNRCAIDASLFRQDT